jgi:hypothetical protein
MTPLTTEQRRLLLDNPPPEREEEFPYLATLAPTQLLQRRVQVSEQLKNLEKERQAIDEELIAFYSDSELRRGLRGPGGWMLRQRQRTSWCYDPETKEQIRSLQNLSQHTGSAHRMQTTYLVLTREEA